MLFCPAPLTSSALVRDYGTELLLRFADFLPLSFSLQRFGGIVFLILERFYPRLLWCQWLAWLCGKFAESHFCPPLSLFIGDLRGGNDACQMPRYSTLRQAMFSY